ncbi:uncharacterized protein KY384_005724 [Bacidia gigantensis]|uniref:uncharacterized protein n=1 Tax=Bacidia gigantensis TaxID=2732470 RepID=UPI001D05AA1D|nr:uncharacterized protein KY384_005724 [Bacidia gigantensis]KAG8529089.1 hypothetical protein KY384_005724 [Bacidia gigantensis]
MRFLSIFLLSLLVTFTHCIPSPQTPSTIPNTFTKRNEDVVHSGNYAIVNCATKATPADLLLRRTYNRLGDVITDLDDHGLSSPYGLKAFFKSASAILRIREVFSRIRRGDSIYPNGVEAAPVLYCLSADDPDEYARNIYNDQCVKKGYPAGTIAGTEFVVLCPLFWTVEIEPGPEECPILLFNRFPRETDGLIQNQFSTLVHELVHLYGVEGSATGMETYGVQEVIELGAAQSVENAANYEYYASFVVAGCTEAPTIFGP